MIAAAPRIVIVEARRLLAQSQQRAAQSLAIADDYVQEGDWLHLIVTPTAEGVSALEFVDVIEAIEGDLRKRFGEEIMIVPARP